MALTSDFEPVRASLLHRTPLPTLEQAISELLSEETWFGTLHPHPVDSVLATPQTRSSPSPQKSTFCNYCQNRSLPSTHLLVNCPVCLCRFCNKTGPGHLQQDCFRNPARASRNGPSTGNFSRSHSHRSGTPFKPMPAQRTAAAASEDLPSPVPIDPSTPVFSQTDVEAMFQHFWHKSGTPSSPALSVTAGNTSWYYIRVKPGVYSEYVVVGEDKTNIALIGDDAATTKITGNRSNAIGFGTPQSATMTVDGEGFIGQSLTIENSAPINSGQAVALNNNANHSAFYKCIFMGYQDTLLANTNSQFYKNCEISGTVDFIFGFASAVFQDCGIYVRRLSPANVITANGGKPNPASTNFGFSFQNCTINVAPELRSRKKEVKAFLGRPWQNYATVVFMESYLDEIVPPEGWTWCCNNTILMFAEYNNRGPGANTSRRAKLSGYKVFKSATEATPFTVSKLIDGDSWIPQTGIPYRGGLNSV
ncbi:pectinesterase-like [Camellia sinensis]|uniref:pectinesterase-like n=1 Tax=Camellia sinensis TaxID=4442 RepID=UPI0010356159|nr:pectinesterase-like [Camellia sinensis]